jgi:glycosyltransferase involved in cell wall biosynthesis
LLPYKNVASVVEAFRELPAERLVIVGEGPDEEPLIAVAPPNVAFVGRKSDDELAWLYASCVALIAASYEDFGLTPLEAAGFGKPSIVLRAGGYLDTMRETTAVFFDQPEPGAIASAVSAAQRVNWSRHDLMNHAAGFAEPRFIDQLRAVVHDVVTT